MAPSYEHDDDSRFLAFLVQALTDELGTDFRAAGSVTMRRQLKKKGIEADESFWLAHASQMHGVRRLDLKIHPPPDLCVEIDVFRTSLDRFAIYAALGVPEIWRLHENELRFYALGESGRYAEAAASRSFPGITPADLIGFVLDARTNGQNPVLRRFREWVRARANS